MVKKLLALLLVCGVLFSLAGCGKEITLNLAYGDRTGTYSGDVNEQGLPHGQGKFTSTNSEGEKWTYEGEFKNGHFDGEGKTTWKSGTVEIGTYKDDVIVPMKGNEIKSLYGEPRHSFGDSVYIYGGGGDVKDWYSPSVWQMNFFFDNDNYYESDLYIRNDLDLLLTKYLDENYFYYQALNDTIDGEIRTLHIYFDTEDPRFAEVIVGKQYNAGQYNDILLIYAPASSLNHSKMRDVVSKKRNQQVD